MSVWMNWCMSVGMLSLLDAWLRGFGFRYRRLGKIHVARRIRRNEELLTGPTDELNERRLTTHQY